MPKLQLRKPEDAPSKPAGSRAVQEQQRIYDDFIRQLDGNVGELELSPDENMRGVKVRLRRAATRLNKPLTIWDANGNVYFQAEAPKRRGRPPKAS